MSSDDFKKNLHVDKEEKNSSNYEEKLFDNIIKAINETKPENREEQIKQLGYLINFSKILNDYDRLMKILDDSTRGLDKNIKEI